MATKLLGIAMVVMLAVGAAASQPAGEPTIESLKKEVAALKAENANLKEQLAREKIAVLKVNVSTNAYLRTAAKSNQEREQCNRDYQNNSQKLKDAIDKFNKDFAPSKIEMPKLPA